MDAVCTEVRAGAGAILIGDEALNAKTIDQLRSVLSAQPRWSDLPVFVMTRPMESGERFSFARRLEGLGNVSLLDRPLRVESIVSAFQMALRARQRQYEIRDFLEGERESAASLSRANAELRRANDDLNQFAYSVSHDLQEPLRMVAIYTQMLQREFGTELGDKAALFMQFAVEGARRVEELLKDLLTYVQVGHRDEDGVTRSDANQILRQALDNLQNVIAESGARVEFGQLPQLTIKPVHLLQVFQNLIGNALKYRSEAQPVIEIQAVRSNENWRFSVRDNGIGVEPQFTEHIFGVFKRLHGGDDKYTGTGIGLAICQKIVDRYGGRIWVESEGPGRGSVFYFTLPAGDGRE